MRVFPQFVTQERVSVINDCTWERSWEEEQLLREEKVASTALPSRGRPGLGQEPGFRLGSAPMQRCELRQSRFPCLGLTLPATWTMLVLDVPCRVGNTAEKQLGKQMSIRLTRLLAPGPTAFLMISRRRWGPLTAVLMARQQTPLLGGWGGLADEPGSAVSLGEIVLSLQPAGNT